MRIHRAVDQTGNFSFKKVVGGYKGPVCYTVNRYCTSSGKREFFHGIAPDQ